jgi:hypothetical protein
MAAGYQRGLHGAPHPDHGGPPGRHLYRQSQGRRFATSYIGLKILQYKVRALHRSEDELFGHFFRFGNIFERLVQGPHLCSPTLRPPSKLGNHWLLLSGPWKFIHTVIKCRPILTYTCHRLYSYSILLYRGEEETVYRKIGEMSSS